MDKMKKSKERNFKKNNNYNLNKYKQNKTSI